MLDAQRRHERTYHSAFASTEHPPQKSSARAGNRPFGPLGTRNSLM
jgi:hypothetical protein